MSREALGAGNYASISEREVQPQMRGSGASRVLCRLSVSAVAILGAQSFEPTPTYAQDGQQSESPCPPGWTHTQDAESSTCIEPASESEAETPSHPRPSSPQVPSRESVTSFSGYNMGSSSFTDGNGCFVTSTASAFRRLNGDSSITPRSVYKGNKIKNMWSPSSGVKGGLLFNALPQMAGYFDIRVKKVGAKGLKHALRDGGQGMMLFNPGYFAGGSGHYVVAKDILPNGNILLDDPNGKGKNGNSERRHGWSIQELKNKGAVKFRALLPRR